jgi:hypothetical protein
MVDVLLQVIQVKVMAIVTAPGHLSSLNFNGVA